MPIAACDGGGHGEGVENGFFGGFDRSGDEWIEMTVGKVCEVVSGFLRIVGNYVGGGKGQHEVAAAVAGGGASTSQAQGGTFGQSG